MSFIDKDERITSWQTKTKHNFIETSVTSSFLSSFFHLDLNCFVQWQTALACEQALLRFTRPNRRACSQANGSCVTSRLYFLFSCHQDLFIFPFYRIPVSWLSYSVSTWSLGQHVCRFSAAIAHLSSFWCFRNLQNHPVSLKIYASLLIANSKSELNIKSRRHPT